MDRNQTIWHFLIECDHSHVAELRNKLYDYIWTMYHDHFSDNSTAEEVQDQLDNLDWDHTDIYLYCVLPEQEDWTMRIKRQTIAFLSAIKRILIT